MLPLDDADWFQSCELDLDSRSTLISFEAEDSVKQYSQNSLRRTQEARQKVVRHAINKPPAEDKTNVTATISEDLADGHTAKYDADLNLLKVDEPRLVLPSDELAGDEVHLIEITQGSSGNHALQDYQMQLMLLEQQNKKRLMMARQENNDTFAADNVRTVERRRNEERRFERLHTQKTAARGSVEAHTLPVSPQEPVHLPQTHNVPPKKAEEPAVQEHKKRKRRLSGGESTQSSFPAQVVNQKAPFAAPDPRMEPSEHLAILYRISCSDFRSAFHPVSVFRDEPIPNSPLLADYVTDPDRPHLNGNAPLFDFDGYMQSDEDDVGFVIVRTVECNDNAVLLHAAGQPLRWKEAIYVKSSIAKVALQSTATCYFQPLVRAESKVYPYRASSPTEAEQDSHRQNRIDPADLFFYHHREQLQAYAKEHPKSSKHIGALLEAIDGRFGAEFADCDALLAHGLITQAHLLKLYKPNELILSGTYGRPAAFILQEWPKLEKNGWLTLKCWALQPDGSGYARREHSLLIPPIDKEKIEIDQLVAYPLRFASERMRTTLLERGKTQWALRNSSQVSYRGWTVSKDQYFPDARFMIDHKMYRKMHEFARAFQFDKPDDTHPYDRLLAYLTTTDEPPEVAYFLMPPEVHGFYLAEKKWIKLFVDCIHPVVWNKKAYDRLVLPDQVKNLIQALITVRTSQRGVKQGLGIAGKRTDITGAKGNGLIMLLHGGPGTGKTLTGESVAEVAEMPLYRVTCGDIGTNAEAVERYLNTVLHLGKIWNCVLLLDEADVFLEERSMSDLKRNSLVSVFLRILEYYDGILILTSNRVGMFDEAFKSRIQVAIHYENLNLSARKKIWRNFLDMLEEDEEDVNFDELRFHLDDLASKELNGRQIRNVLTTARQLAMYRNERLDWQHLQQALAVSSDFSAYLKRMQGHTDDQRARDVGLR